MDNAGTYLLKSIAQSETNGLASMGEFNAKHFNDVTKIMMGFLKDSLTEIIEHLNKGETIDVDGTILSLKKKNIKKKSR